MMDQNTFERQLPEDFGYSFGDIAQIKSPNDAITELLGYIGRLFACERVYIFDKNETGSYDCTDEWVRNPELAKKDQLQNLPEQSTRFYYNHFHICGKLVIRDMEEFKQEDYTLYKILKPQGLKSLICCQLLYDGKDRGFFGLDNPCPKRFDELESFLPVLSYYLSIQINNRKVSATIEAVAKNSSSQTQNTLCNSIYAKMSQLRKEEPLAVLYSRVTVNGDQIPQPITIRRAEKLLQEIFPAENIYPLKTGEYILLIENIHLQGHVSQARSYVERAYHAMQSENIHLFTGIVTTTAYRENLFELINQAHSGMLREQRNFRNQIISKYQMEEQTEEFTQLIEIRPSDDTFRVLHQESEDELIHSGTLSYILDKITENIVDEDKEAFRQFIDTARSSEVHRSEQWRREFRIRHGKYAIKLVQISVIKYIDANGDIVYLCYTNK